MARIPESIALIFHAKREAAHASRLEMQNDIDKLLSRAGVLA